MDLAGLATPVTRLSKDILLDVKADVVVVGGGLVGLAAARELGQRGLTVALIEKEGRVAAHQSGHNSGVIHSGLYYKPGSYRARLCISGRTRLAQFCAEKSIPHEICGKLVVATRPEELPRLHGLFARGTENGLRLRALGPEEIKEFEPHARGLAAIHVPEAGIADYPGVAQALAADLQNLSGAPRLGVKFIRARETANEVVVETSEGAIEARLLVACAGLQADRVARASGVFTDVSIAPFRGEYYELKPERQGLVRNLIYPVPDPRFPFLGVHFTRMVRGGVEAGPNAVFALKREGYTWGDISVLDLFEAVTSPGFLRFTSGHFGPGVTEIVRSFSKTRFAETLAGLVPEIRAADLQAGGSGVRAMALLPDGTFVDDFHFVETARMVHVLNAPSPAATACLAIGEEIAHRVISNHGVWSGRSKALTIGNA